ncbi:hypothetical protein H8S33_18720 [Ornithinibacillus sp. BX22]|uniref:DUF4181 domain-containing protein n=2 Tax=Ornithinibacillus TaxID=484508 RepID=A0A923L911_9BACI|nr:MULTISPECIES: hypothetical protein [Ornithinibacillus]MBC5638808.1 hypothetical protein [Ornithinibacillus hominis]MBS3679801.1 hypothetical protein [Ornithinibacillus massiliensis]
MDLISLIEVVKSNEILFILLYCCIILWINYGYLKEHKEIKKGLGAITEEEEKEMFWKTDSISVLLFAVVFNFFRRWLFYLIAVLMIDNIIITIIAVVLFIIGLYDAVFNVSIARLRKSNLSYYLAIIDTILVVLFVIFLLYVN